MVFISPLDTLTRARLESLMARNTIYRMDARSGFDDGFVGLILLVGDSPMSNSFPGMDPYLEGDLWLSVHNDLTGEIARQLAPKLRPKYAVLSTRRVILADAGDPDIDPQSRFPDN